MARRRRDRTVTGQSRPRRGSGRRLTGILRELTADETQARVSVADMLASMGERAFGALMLVFALPNILPTPPGTSAILGIPLVILAMQLTLGRKPWLPAFVAARSMTRADFIQIVDRIEPLLMRAEKLLKPRLTMLVYGSGERIIGAFCLLLALMLALPIPLGNILPAAGICLFSFALLERDGFWAIAGYVMTVISTVIVAGVLYALAKAAWFIFANAFA
jgi:hypothetical protein